MVQAEMVVVVVVLEVVAVSHQTTEMETATKTAVEMGHQEVTKAHLAALAVILPILTVAVMIIAPKLPT